MKRRVLLAATLLAANAWAQSLPAVPPPQSQPLIITNATLHTVSGASLPGASMRVERGRIVAIAPAGQALPASTAAALTVDLGGKHVYPGFIAANTSLGLIEIGQVRATVDTTELGPINPNARALVAVNADSELLPVARAGGVLAALAVPSSPVGGLIGGTSALVQLDGWNWQEMALQDEVALHITLPSLRNPTLRLEGRQAALAPELRRFTEERLKLLDDALESAAAYHRARSAEPTLPQDSRWEAMRPVFSGQRAVFVHADELAQIRHALALAERHGFKPVIVGGADAWRIAGMLKERQVPVIITAVHRLPLRRDDDVDAPFRLAARLHEAGVKFAIARGLGGSSNERNLPFEAATAVAHGLPREEALKAITLYPAQILGVADRLGALAPGLLASFIVTDGDPLLAQTRIERLFVQGREVSLDNRQSRLVERYRQRYRQR
jgi:imidazolonepropionase-like amidohydrolase